MNLFPGTVIYLRALIRLEYIGFGEQDAKFAYFLQIFIVAKQPFLGWLKIIILATYQTIIKQVGYESVYLLQCTHPSRWQETMNDLA